MAEITADDFKRVVTLYIPDAVTTVAFSNDNRYLVVGAADKVHIFELSDRVKGKTAASTTFTGGAPPADS